MPKKWISIVFCTLLALSILGFGHSHYGATNPIVYSSAIKTSSSISCELSSTTLRSGEIITYSGSISPPLSGVTVYLQYSNDNGETWNTIDSVETNSNGFYSTTSTWTGIGSVIIESYWNGDEEYEGASSPIQMLEIESWEFTLSLSVTPISVTIGSSVEIGGSIYPVVEDARISISYRTIGGAWIYLAFENTSSDGSYSYAWTPTIPGTFEVHTMTFVDKEKFYTENGLVESDIVSFNVTKLPSSIVCSVSSKDIEMGEKVTVSGHLYPPMVGVSVTLTYEKPDGSNIQRSVITTSDGFFSDTFTPDLNDEWRVIGRWSGDDDYQNTISTQVSFTVESDSSNLIDYFTQPDYLALILGVVSLSGGSIAWYIRRTKNKRARNILDEIDQVYSRFKMNSRRCEAELYRLKDVTFDMLKTGKIDESIYDVIKGRIDEYLNEIREQIIDERLGGFPSKLKDNLLDMIKKNEISEKEYETLSKLIEGTSELKESEKIQLKELMENWKKDNLKNSESEA